MLGNFSFGDYFKEEAILWAWEYVSDVLRLDKDRLLFTVHPTDDEARDLWVKKVGIDPLRVITIEENFWTMGDTGPCGPCSEIFFDQGSGIAGGPPGSKDEDGDRFLEIWNLVFPQFDRQPDGELQPLAQPGVDTGLGLERLAAVTQGVDSNYGIDLFKPLFASLVGFLRKNNNIDVVRTPSCRVIADHVRSASFLISDGILPDREGRGYVLRRIIRRALRHGHKLGITKPFLHALVAPLVESMGDAYPGLASAQNRIASAIEDEEAKFGETMRRGLVLLENALRDLSGSSLSGDVAFKLYDTYGFPVDLTEDIAQEHQLSVDRERFDVLMEEQKARARDAGQFKNTTSLNVQLDDVVKFLGYSQLSGKATIQRIFTQHDGELIESDSLRAEHEGAIVLDQTSFYGEAGGQIGDVGYISQQDARFRVSDVKRVNEQFVHLGSVEAGTFDKGQSVCHDVEPIHRQDVARNHTATHLLHAALRSTLGDHVQQRGSLVDAARLRFDFSHDKPLTLEERGNIERIVNDQILNNDAVSTAVLPYDDAVAGGAIALFGEKYDDEVRVLTIGDGYSVELCGGTHVPRTGEIGVFKIVSESGIAAGTRRVEAVTGRRAYDHVVENEDLLNQIGDKLGAADGRFVARIERLLDERTELQKKLEAALSSNLQDRGAQLVDDAVSIGDVTFIAQVVDGDAEALMATYEDVQKRINDHVVVLSTVEGVKCQVVVGVSKSLTSQLVARDVIEQLSKHASIRGGGKPMFARAGGTASPSELEEGFKALQEWLVAQLAK